VALSEVERRAVRLFIHILFGILGAVRERRREERMGRPGL